MDELIIQGGHPLTGEVTIGGAKNSGFKLMVASLLSDDVSRIERFSRIGDIVSTAQIISELGGRVVMGDDHFLTVNSSGLNKCEFSEKVGRLSRASTYFAGPLLYRFGRAVIPVPGGCKIGRRPLDRHLDGFKALGAKVKNLGDRYEISANRLRGANFRFPKSTHGGTDVMIMAAVLAEGRTVLENAALETEVDDLINFLNQMGAKISRKEGRKIVIEGVKKLNGTTYEVMPDRNEAVTFACVALITKGDIFVKRAQAKTLGAFLQKLDEVGGGYEVNNAGMRFFYRSPLKSCRVVSRPYPGFMTDWQALWTVLMTQAKGASIVHETIFENRFGFVDNLIKMGAKIELYNPEVRNPQTFYNFNLEDNHQSYFHAAKVHGPVSLRSARLLITDIRAGATLILAALAADGKSELLGLDHIDRGYENLEGRLEGLGGKITRIRHSDLVTPVVVN